MKPTDYNCLLNYELAYQALEHLTVSRVVRYMQYTLCGENHEIYCNGDSTTPLVLATNPHVAGSLAGNIHLWFWGGPPKKEEWYEGSLLTMLLDRLWYAVVVGRYDVVDGFLETLNGNHTRTQQKNAQDECESTAHSEGV